MPKKFEGSSRGEPAKVRKAEKEKAERERQEKAKEDASWVDDDKDFQRKQERQAEKLKKQQELAARKAEVKLLESKETADLDKRDKQASRAKVTQAEINENRRRSEVIALEEAARISQAQRRLTVQEELTENPNQISLDENEEEARGVAEAIELLSPGSFKMEKQKSLFAQFSEEMTPQIQAENPGLKLSQVRERVKRAWSRSPANPANQAKA
eukprot:m.49308 g.49308  ORF g.49308 m.49308 type:complete len:213 (-) comp12809_c0_seq1:361-999(-)